jgi:REP element-mobilizing transposase RayT
MHLVLRSSKARGEWSFRRAKNRRKVEEILGKFSRKFAVRILSIANVGNHLHLHIRLTTRQTYKPFIRAITAAIAMAVTGRNRWTKKSSSPSGRRIKFWDYQPYTRVVLGFKALLGLRDYIRINQLEGFGCDRREAVKKRYAVLFSYAPFKKKERRTFPGEGLGSKSGLTGNARQTVSI